MSESNYKTNDYNPANHGWWKATLDNAENFGYPQNYNFSDSMRATMIAFGNYFNDIWVVRYDEMGFPRKRIQVPIKFGPRSKAFDQRKELESGKTYYISYPNLTWKINGIVYNGDSEVSPDTVRTFYDTYLMELGVGAKQLDLLWQDTTPVPYKVNVELCANCEKMSDAMQLLEQICGRFRPDAFVYLKEFWFINLRRDIKMILESTSFEYNEDYGEEEKRELTVKFNIVIDTMIYTGVAAGNIMDQIRITLNPSISKTSEPMDLHYSFSGYPDGRITLDYGGDRKEAISEISANVFNYNETEDYYTVKPEMYKDGFVKNTEISHWDLDTGSFVVDRLDYTFNSSYRDTVNEPYESNFNISGNYKPNYSSYNSNTVDYDGSLTDRYDLQSSEFWKNSGTKDFHNNSNDVIRTKYITENSNNEGKSK